MRKLTIYLLGDVVFRLGDGPPLPLAPGKTSALLAYLAVEAAHPHPRQSLAALFWPERPDTEALAALRFALSNLRAVLQDRDAAIPFLLIDRARVRLNPQAEVWVDAVAFRAQAAACEAAFARADNQSDAPSVAALHAALKLYQGPFLQGFNLGDSLDFESWSLRMREQLERQWLRLLHYLGTQLEAVENYTQATEAYRAILESQPWDEDAHRCLMRALAANGEYGAALAQYMACRQSLDDLGIEPGRATNALYQRLKREQAAPGTVGEPVTIPFVARDRELARLAIALERALAEQGQVVLVTGEAGSGKTALLNAFAQQAMARHPDLLVVGGGCDAYAGEGQPYQPFIESVQMLVGAWETLPWAEQFFTTGQERLLLSLSRIAQTLVETAPDLLDRVINRGDLAQRVQMQSERTRPLPSWQKMLRRGSTFSGMSMNLEKDGLFEQVTRFFTKLARQRPLVLLLDDLQWIDTGSAALLFHLARRLVRSRILLVAAYRPGEIHNRTECTMRTGQHPLLGVVTELQRYGGDIWVDLDQVDERAFVAAFLEKDPLLSPNRLDEAFCAALARRTGGNPLFTIELLRSLQARDEIQRGPDGSWVSNPTLNWEHLPERVEAAVAGRIAHLSDPWHDWLSTASVEGGSFTAEVLAYVHNVDIATVTRDLSGFLGMGQGARRLVRSEGVRWLEGGEQPRRLSRYRFRHSLFQAYLYQQLDPVERAQRHAAVGFALEDLYVGQPGERARHAAELARHFEVGGLPFKAATYHLEAGRQALYLASLQGAVAHYRQGLALLAEQPHTPDRDRLEIRLHLALGAPFLSANGWGGPERRDAIQQALALLQATAPQPFGAEWDESLLALHAQADWLISQGELQPAAQLGAQLLTLAGGHVSLPGALAHRILGISFLFQGRFPEALQHLEDALAVYRAVGQPDTLPWTGGDLQTTCQVLLGFVLAVSGYLDQAWTQASQALYRAQHIRHPSTIGKTLIFACEVAVLRGDLVALQDLATELLRVGEHEDMRFFMAYGCAAQGYVQACRASPGSEQAEASVDLIRRGMRMWESTATQAGIGMWIVRLVDACLQAGDIAAGLAITTDILATPTQPGIEAGLSHLYRLHGELLLRQSLPDRETVAAYKAEASFQQALDIARQQSARTLELRAALSLTKLWCSTQPDAARRLLADLYAWFTEGLDTPDLQEAAALLSNAGCRKANV